ncbi:MAG TPA: 50S ribosomal protein L29 [Nitrospirae bacterium]|nr:50S ribosomal protein L29 [bacterium BMS3Abin10]GBE38705.1 50S ribosomal protein L29 [bacterium BMS3Bbin08]HDH51081.1 50S ribosomal protein L29 [Nitrospirota bacterium]HDK17776.1 50S ribosomal protein L29 [Nitrospirota bacterium]HDK41165.1 50S ribosomal protein L29 [Nitrospirota bacterium]
MNRTSELKTLTVEELKQEELNLKKELFNLRFQQTTGEIENPMRIRQVRKDIARVYTIVSGKLKVKN